MSPDEKFARVADVWETLSWKKRGDLLKALSCVTEEVRRREPDVWGGITNDGLTPLQFTNLPEDLRARLILAFNGETLSFEQYARTMRLTKDGKPPALVD